ncbi:MAG: hypothetical protein KME20_28285 [Kaiparowitsia implicata GSE-PSE-MK54-09C]|nr:hypothetical protein [Kaiparowitsia implicata GSE-PSE-MK54-09C]
MHVGEFGGEAWQKLAFQDALSEQAELAHAYEELKVSLSLQFSMIETPAPGDTLLYNCASRRPPLSWAAWQLQRTAMRSFEACSMRSG